MAYDADAVLPETGDPRHAVGRRWWIAGLLSIVMAGAGHLYCGRLRYAAVVIAVYWIVSAVGLAILAYLPVDGWCLFLGTAPVVLCYLVILADALRLAARTRLFERRWYHGGLGCAGLIVAVFILSLAIALTIRQFWLASFVLPSGGMADTLLSGDRFLVDKRFTNPLERGRVVLYHSDGPGTPVYVHRIIGLPGDEVEIRDERVFVNGAEVDEPYAKHEGPSLRKLARFGPETVPAGALFVLGDHRRRSADSRMRGYTPVEFVVGTPLVVYWSDDVPEPDPRTRFRPGARASRGVRWDRLGRRVR